MSFISILIPLAGVLLFYYAGMIAYDCYIDKLKQTTTTGNIEDEIDISSELEGFSPIEVNRKEEKGTKPVSLCCGIEIEKLRDLMENVANGKTFEGLDNISYRCLAAG